MTGNSFIVAVVGPTGTGKTSVAIELATRLGAEIVSADSRQVYRYMNIGTAKPTVKEQLRARHHLIDIVNPDVRFSAGKYGRLARQAINDLVRRKIPVLVVGGAGLYIKVLTEGLLEGPEIPQRIRNQLTLEYREKTAVELHQRLAIIDPLSAQRIHENDRQRVERALEIHDAIGMTLTDWLNRDQSNHGFKIYLIGLDWEREALYERINQRVFQMLDCGFEQEVMNLLNKGYGEDAHGMSTFGYSEILSYIRGNINLENAISIIQKRSRHYAKRQLTWFRKISEIKWIPVTSKTVPEEISEKILKDHLTKLF